MPSEPAKFRDKIIIGGETFDSSAEIPYDSVLRVDPSAGFPAAVSGSLSVRTNDTDGSLNLLAGHGIVDADEIDIFWTVDSVRGSRRGVTVGTVAGTVVPISGGTGDNLPVVDSPLTASKPTEKGLVVTAAETVFIAVKMDAPGFVSFCKSDGSVVLPVEIKTINGTYKWYTGSGSNPFTDDITKVKVSHEDYSTSRSVRILVGILE